MSSILATDMPSETGLEGNDPGATIVPSGTPSEEIGKSEAEAYQKLQGENDKLKSQSEKLQIDFDAYKRGVAPKEQFYDAFQNKPEWIPVVQKAIEGYESGETEVVQEGFNPEEDFIPEEAYKSGTSSYKFREDQEDKRIQKAVNTAVGGIQEDMLLDKTQKKLVADGMSPEDSIGYIEFLRDPEKYPGGREILLGPMAKAYTQFKSGNTTEGKAAEEAAATQGSFPSAGAYSGGAEAPRSEVDKIMDSIVAAGHKRSILKNPM